MSEETASPIVKTVLLDEDGSVITRGFVFRTIQIPTRVRIPVILGGVPVSDEELAKWNVTKKTYTQEELDAEEMAAVYAENPTLSLRIRQYKNLLAGLGLDASATSDAISAAISASDMTDAEKTAAAASVLALIHDIELNYDEVSDHGLEAWRMMEKLVRYLPEEDGVETEKGE